MEKINKQFRDNGRFGKERKVEQRNKKSELMKKIHAKPKYKNLSGRRIIDIHNFAQEMWCKKCDYPLSFRFLVKEDLIGLASIFHMQCPKCQIIYLIHSSTYQSQHSRSQYAVNLKAALAMLDAGIGETHLNVILSALNIPTMDHKLVKRYEEIVGPVIEAVAKESCHEALKIEKDLTIAHEGYPSEEEDDNIQEDNRLEELNNLMEEGGDSNSLNVNSSLCSPEEQEKSDIAGGSCLKRFQNVIKIGEDLDCLNVDSNLYSTNERGKGDIAGGSCLERFQNVIKIGEDLDCLNVDSNLYNKANDENNNTEEIDDLQKLIEENNNSDGSNTHSSLYNKDHNVTLLNEKVKNDVKHRDETLNFTRKRKKLGLHLSYDAAWLKKGSGKCYNSKQGYGTAYGHYSRKCVAFGTRNKSCRRCGGQKGRNHDCRRNFKGSSKSMEADIAVEILIENKQFDEENVQLKTAIGDEDACTIASLRRSAHRPIQKWTDINHATKNLAKLLYQVKSLPRSAVPYFRYCFISSIRTNKGDVESTRAAILQIVPHVFGEHNKCTSWCTYNKDPKNFKHKYLPRGKPLTGDALKISVCEIFERFAAKAEKLAPCGSSQINENGNAVITSKASKSRHYSSSASSDFLVAAGVCQINLGRMYIERINCKLALSPLKKKARRFRLIKDEFRKKTNTRIKTIEFKKRRRALFRNRQQENSSLEAQEGITYQSNCEMDVAINVVEESNQLLSSLADNKTQIVFFDVETTGLYKTDEIVQIAATSNELQFNTYILPTCPFSEKASKINGFTVNGGKLYKKSEVEKTVPFDVAVKKFIEFLRKVSPTVILVGHNIFSFDVPRIIRLVIEANMFKEFQSVVLGFSDTIKLLRQKLCDRRKEKKSFAQSSLASDYLHDNFNEEEAHDALADVTVLQQLLKHNNINISSTDLIESGKTLCFLINEKKEKKKIKKIKNALQVLQVKKDSNSNIIRKGISSNMITKLAKCGITFEQLKNIYNQAGFGGLKILFSQSVGNHLRITSNKKIIMDVFEKLQELEKINNLSSPNIH